MLRSITPKRATTSLAASVDPTDARYLAPRRRREALRDCMLSAPADEPPGSPMHGASPGNRAGPCAAAPFDRTIIRSLRGGALKSGVPTPILKRLGIPGRPPGDNS